MKTSEKIVKILKNKYKIDCVDYAIVVGSGLIKSAPELTNKIKIDYCKIGMPKSKVKGHSGSFIFGEYNGKKVVLVSRIHYYECADLNQVRLPFEIVAGLGVKNIVLLTSCGGLNESFKVGDVMLIEDHINFSGINPLIGINKMEFTDMSNAYSKKLRDEIKQLDKESSLNLKYGVFCQMSGPSYETLAEVDMLKRLGGDAVSMSTALDCIIANYLKMQVVGFSVIVNVFTNNNQKLTHEEVLENAEKACFKVKTILSNLIK